VGIHRKGNQRVYAKVITVFERCSFRAKEGLLAQPKRTYGINNVGDSGIDSGRIVSGDS
jgi:hypothetical protein